MNNCELQDRISHLEGVLEEYEKNDFRTRLAKERSKGQEMEEMFELVKSEKKQQKKKI